MRKAAARRVEAASKRARRLENEAADAAEREAAAATEAITAAEEFDRYCADVSDAIATALAVAEGTDRLATRVRSPRAVKEELDYVMAKAADTLPEAAARAAPGAASEPWQTLRWERPKQVDEPPPLVVGNFTVPELGLDVPLLMPLIGAGAVHIDDDLAPRSAGLALVRGILLRAFAVLPPGQFEAVVYDSVRLTLDFDAFREAFAGQDLFRVATDTAELRREVRRLVGRARGARNGTRSWAFLVCMTAPELTGDDLLRFRALARNSAEIGVTVVIPGPVDLAEQISFRSTTSPSRLVDHRGRPFAPVGPPNDLVVTVGRQVTAAARAGLQHTLSSLATGNPWSSSSEENLAVPIGFEGDRKFSFTLNDDTPHALVIGSAGWGKSNLLRYWCGRRSTLSIRTTSACTCWTSNRG